MTATVEQTPGTPLVDTPPPGGPAGWWVRTAAWIVDVLPAAAVAATMVLVAATMNQHPTWRWVCLSVAGAAILLAGANRVLLPTVTGWTLGKALCGTAVVRPDGAAVGPGRLLLRELAHLLDTVAVFLGWLWPLWDRRRRTFADLLLGTEEHRIEPDRRPRRIRRPVAAVWSIATLLCVAGAAVSVAVIYLPQRASDRTRAEIATQGPTIVTQMLSYDPKTLHDDFTRALALTTEKYRHQLAEQQEAVQKRHPVVNEYWVTNSAVLSAEPHRAAMLLFLQGHRGGGNENRFITATVRVSFDKGADGRWLVDDLAVVTKPKPAKGEK
ncbi:RDD family protein [Mycobacterium sp.]|uniref:RDD family protein n=1 Tax=Mycobacterium sp. TaxID=1785 RepID=UPI001275F621|nr:RDD family protein [Mycobacterium sp.]KAA8967493.1 MAG: RDD family protein [Mycobacterium sp.]